MKPTNMPKQQSWIHFYLFFVGNALEGGVVTQLHILHDGVVQRASRSRRESREKSLYSSICKKRGKHTETPGIFVAATTCKSYDLCFCKTRSKPETSMDLQ